MLQTQHFSIDFGFKSEGETQYEGQEGVLVQGYATRFNEVDQEDEHVTPDALSSAARTFFDDGGNGPVPILYHHGLDQTLSTKRIGRIVDWKIDSVGLWIKAFLPKPPDAKKGDAVGRKAQEVYEAVRNGLLNGFSIGGVFGRLGRAIKSVGLYEVSITPIPCLDSARFQLAQKSLPAVTEAMSGPGGRPLVIKRSSLGDEIAGEIGALIAQQIQQAIQYQPGSKDCMPGAIGAYDMDQSAGEDDMTPDDKDMCEPQVGLSRKGHAKALKVALAEKSLQLHDHLLHTDNYPSEAQGAHDPEDCGVCSYRRVITGIKALRISDKPWSQVDKSDLPRSSYLDQGDPDHRSTWRYPVYEADGALNTHAVANAYARASAQGEEAIIKKLQPLRQAVGFTDDTPAAPGKKDHVETGEGSTIGDETMAETGDVTVSVKTLSPTSLPTRMATLLSLSVDLAHLHANLSPRHETDGADAVETDGTTTDIDGKAGRTLSGLSLAALRGFASQVVQAGQELHAWLDKYAPDLEPVQPTQDQDAGKDKKPAADTTPNTGSSASSSPTGPAKTPAKKS